MQNDADAGVCVDRMSRFRSGSGFVTIGGNLRISVFFGWKSRVDCAEELYRKETRNRIRNI